MFGELFEIVVKGDVESFRQFFEDFDSVYFIDVVWVLNVRNEQSKLVLDIVVMLGCKELV